MKWSAIATLFAAPLVLAGSLQAELVARGSEGGDVDDKYGNSHYGSSSGTTIIVEEVVLVWVCDGAGSATTTVNSVTNVKGSVATHSVTVGGSAGLVYTPDTIEAEVGDMVVFTFLSLNHTVTSSSFDTPCEKLSGKIDSGFKPNVNNTVVPPPQMAIQVNVSTPLWFYCRQKGHCGKGMVFSINPTAAKTQEMFKQMAIAQNGTGSTAGIVATSSAYVANTAAANAYTTLSTSTSAYQAVATQTAVSTNPGMSYGTGSTGSGDACSCSCFCGVAQFPSAVQGLEGFGGMSGSIPMKLS